MSEFENEVPQQESTANDNQASNPTNTNISFSNIWVWVVLGLSTTVTTVSGVAWKMATDTIEKSEKEKKEKDEKIESLYLSLSQCDERAIEKMKKNIEEMRSIRLGFSDDINKEDKDIKSYQKGINALNQATEQIKNKVK